MASNPFYDSLRGASLEKYYAKFTSRGVSDVEGLLSMTLQDYPAFGVTSMIDRERLFNLIQNLKNVEEETAGTVQKIRRTEVRGKNYGPAAVEGTERIVTGRRGSLKRSREATGNSPAVAEKLKSKTQVLEKPARMSTKAPTPIRNKSKEDVITTGKYYNYGVPSSKAKSSPSKKVVTNPSSGSRIRVCVRKRPQSEVEVVSGEVDVVEVTGRDKVTVTAPKVTVDLTKYTQKHQFLFDEAFDESCDNQEIYERTAKTLIQTVFNRGKAMCFAYGCTGSGKTYTMLGNEVVQGIYILAASDIFSVLHSGVHGQGLGLWVSFYEIYCGQLFDLLNARSRLFAREDGHQQVCIVGLTEQHVNNVEELMEVIEYGGNVRSTGSTGVNADSSRSHAILQLQLKIEKSEEKLGRFSFIDLAGSERAADVTDTDKQTRLEGAEINQSLLALKECIRALDLDSRHTPFRQSKLTQVLKDSFIGNSQTCMIANISPGMSCSENTLNTLRYADRVKELKKDSTGDIHSPRPVTVHGTDSQLWPLTSTSAAVNETLLPRVVIEPLASGQSSEHLHRALKKLKMADLTSNVAIRPRTSLTEPATTSKQNIAISTRRSLTRSNNSTVRAAGNSNNMFTHSSVTARPRTSPNVAVVLVKPVNVGGTEQVIARTDKDILYNADNLRLKVMASPEPRPRLSKQRTKQTKPTRNERNVKCTRTDYAEKRTTVTFREDSQAKSAVRNVQSCEKMSRKCAGAEDRTKRRTNAGRPLSLDDKPLLRNVQICEDVPTERTNTVDIKKVVNTGQFPDNLISSDSKRLLRNVQSCEDVPSERSTRVDMKKRVNTGKHQDNFISSDDKRLLRNVQSCEVVSSKHIGARNDEKSVVAEKFGNKLTSDAKPLRNIQSHEDVSDARNRANWDETSPSINTRYRTGLKTKIAKFFGGKNTATTNDEQTDPGLSVQLGHRGSTGTSSTLQEVRSRRRQYTTSQESQNVKDSSLTEEQVIAAHHTQLALVTGLCHEEMVLLRQIDAGKQDFLDYISELDDILTRKMSCIESLRGKITRYSFK